MKKMKGFQLLLVVFIAVLIVGCTQQAVIVIPNAPINLRATALVGTVGVELRWDAVNGAVSYAVTITKQAASGSRETFGPYNTTNTYYLATRDILGAGTFDWSVTAVNTAGPSTAAAGTQFTLAPEPEPEPEYGLVLTLEEKPDAVSYRKDVPAIRVYGGHENDDSSQRGHASDFFAFNYILATLEYRQLLALEGERQNMSVQLMVERVGSGEAKRWPDSDTEYLLDEDGQLVIGINDLGENFGADYVSIRDIAEDPLEPGQYYFWARASWDNEIQSTKERFDIVLLEDPLTGSIVLKDEEGKEYTTQVCPTSTEVTLIYEVSVEGGEWFSELNYEFCIGQQGEDGTVETTESGTFTTATEFSTEVTYATECTKYATLTLNGTGVIYAYDNEEATEVTGTLYAYDYIVASHSFVLDMADPTAFATIITVPFTPSEPASLTAVSIGFFAFDTKCLHPYDENIHFNVYVDKGTGNWEGNFDFFDEEVVLGEGSVWNNEITIEGTYAATKVSENAFDYAYAIFDFDIPVLDLSTITSTMTVHDCCCETCILDDPCVECGVGGNLTHATEVSIQFAVDNVFFSSMLDHDEVVHLDGFATAADDNPIIPASPNFATITVVFADANWGIAEMNMIASATYDEAGNVFDIALYPADYSIDFVSEGYVCSGYATKVVLTSISTITGYSASDPTEVLLTFVATAIDSAGNAFGFEHQAWLDTLPPTLTHFTAFRDQINNHSWIEFAFNQEPETAELALTVTASGTFLYDLEDAEEITGQENAYRLNTGVTLPYDTVLTLGATSTDLAGNVGFATKQATVSLSSPR
jgi:hypothetical protein